MLNLTPDKLPLLEVFKAPGMLEKYRAWVANPDTLRFLTLASELVLPGASDERVRSSHPEAVAHLVKKETVEDFSMACLQLERYASISSTGGLPAADYGAQPEAPLKPRKPKTAKPAQAK